MIELEHITKTFRVARRETGLGSAFRALFRREHIEIAALCDLSFQIGDGEMVGYIGPNGSGKSSTVKVMSGILTPDSGRCVIDGLTPWKGRKQHVKNIGVVFGQRTQLWWDVPVGDSFSLLGDIYGMERTDYRNSLDELTERLHLGDLLKTPARQLSLGQRMRCEIAASLLHRPRILFLDEPTIGLDAPSKLAVREFVRELNRERKTTVLLTTHDTQDLEALCDRILLLGHGRLLFDGTLDELRKKSGGIKTVTVTYSGPIPQLPEGAVLRSVEGGRAVYSVDPRTLPLSEAIGILGKCVGIADLSIADPSADELVLALYREYQI